MLWTYDGTGSVCLTPRQVRYERGRMYVAAPDVRQYRSAEACEAQVFIKGRTSTPHSDACRQIMMELLEEDDEGRASI